mmetsp:Transcript_110673/g.174425  ORF Transcript_110673/g.174425 Transcript_110673/m.174425 type:complete len:141 (-) Transcript_110673:3-425(-)
MVIGGLGALNWIGALVTGSSQCRFELLDAASVCGGEAFRGYTPLAHFDIRLFVLLGIVFAYSISCFCCGCCCGFLGSIGIRSSAFRRGTGRCLKSFWGSDVQSGKSQDDSAGEREDNFRTIPGARLVARKARVGSGGVIR